MEIARIQISGVKAKVLTKKIITAGMIGAEVYIEYTDPAWDKLNKTVVFNGNVIKDVIKPGVIVPVPPETIASPSRHLYVGVYGTDTNNNTAIPTLWADLGEVHTAADPSGDSSTNPSLPVYAQLLEMKTGPAGSDGKPGRDGKDYLLTDADKAEIAEQAAKLVDVPGSGGNVDFQVDETLSLKDGILSVNTTNDMEQDNTLPITSAGVYATVGNIEALLKTI